MAGGNFGWRPGEPCGDFDPGYLHPLFEWTPPVSPTGITFYTGNQYPQYQGDMFVVTFNAPQVIRFRLNAAGDALVEDEVMFSTGGNPMLDIVDGPDGYLYYSDYFGIYRVIPSSTGVESTNAPQTTGLRLEASRPNPARLGGASTIPLELGTAGPVKLTIHDAQGRLVETLWNAPLTAGSHAFQWRHHAVAAGVYFYRVASGALEESGRLVVMP